MKCCLGVCFVFVLMVEMGFYNFLVRPLTEPIKLYGGHYMRALQRKKRYKLYNLKTEYAKMDIEGSDDEEDRRNSLAARKFLKIVDTDPQIEE